MSFKTNAVFKREAQETHEEQQICPVSPLGTDHHHHIQTLYGILGRPTIRQTPFLHVAWLQLSLVGDEK